MPANPLRSRPRRPAPAPPLLAGTGVLLLFGAAWWWWQMRRPLWVGMVQARSLTPGAAINPTHRYSADLFLAEHPQSRIRLVNAVNGTDPSNASRSIAALKRQGVRFYVTAFPSNHALRALHHFQRGDALTINVSSASNQLSGRDDYLLRVVPDVEQEQRAIARELARRPGGRLLVLQDSGNRPYTDAALAVFRPALAASGRWQVTHRTLAVARFRPESDRTLLEGDFDALYLLAGSFLPSIGPISQLFHRLHPHAAIVLTPWARSPQILENAGPANAVTTILSPYPSRASSPSVAAYLRRFEARFHYTPYALSIGTRQALELFDQAFASGATTPAAVKRYLLSRPSHPTSFGPVRFDASGDVRARFHAIDPTSDLPR